jgi:uncharacterized protein YeaO (DUF488 family)
VGVIALGRVYDLPEQGAERRFLVERLWPRGIRRDALGLAEWLPDVGPSSPLRKWFGHDPQRWDEFRRRYFAELDGRPEAWRPLYAAAATGDITLLFSSRDVAHNNAVALREYLTSRLDEGESR